MLRIITLALAMFYLISIGSPAVKACDCDPPPPRKVYKTADAVFIGQVIDISESKVPLFKDQPDFGSWAVTFRVIKYWKGVKGPEIVVHSDLGGLMCHQFRFNKGETYLVYADGKNLIAITGCTRSGPIDAQHVIEQLKFLGKAKAL
jgi:hypothetical protein